MSADLLQIGGLGARSQAALTAAAPAGMSVRAGGGFEAHLRAAQASQGDEEARTAAAQLVASTLVLPVLEMLRESPLVADRFAPGDAERRFGPLLDLEIADRITRSPNFPLVDRVAEHLMAGRGRGEPSARASRMTEMPDTAATADPARTDEFDRLLPVLTLQIEGHERLLACMNRKREAIRVADIDAIARMCREENEIIQRLGEIEKCRLEIIGRMTERFAPEASRPLSLREVTHLVEGARRSRLGEMADGLRDVVERVAKESAIIRTAADRLSRHMTGIVQTIHGALNRFGVYERRGRIAVGTQMDFHVDVKS